MPLGSIRCVGVTLSGGGGGGGGYAGEGVVVSDVNAPPQLKFRAVLSSLLLSPLSSLFGRSVTLAADVQPTISTFLFIFFPDRPLCFGGAGVAGQGWCVADWPGRRNVRAFLGGDFGVLRGGPQEHLDGTSLGHRGWSPHHSTRRHSTPGLEQRSTSKDTKPMRFLLENVVVVEHAETQGAVGGVLAHRCQETAVVAIVSRAF